MESRKDSTGCRGLRWLVWPCPDLTSKNSGQVWSLPYFAGVAPGSRVFVGGGSEGGAVVTLTPGRAVGVGWFGPLVGVGASAEPSGPQVGSEVIANRCA